MKTRKISFKDLPQHQNKEELFAKKKQEIIKKYGKPLKKPLNKKEIIRRFGYANT